MVTKPMVIMVAFCILVPLTLLAIECITWHSTTHACGNALYCPQGFLRTVLEAGVVLELWRQNLAPWEECDISNQHV